MFNKAEINNLKHRMNRLEFPHVGKTGECIYVELNKKDNSIEFIKADEFDSNSKEHFCIPLKDAVKQLILNSNLVMTLAKATKEDTLTLHKKQVAENEG